MKVAIVGYREFNDYPFLKNKLDELKLNIDTVVSGGAKGVDTLAERYAKEKGYATLIFRPDYLKHGRRAPLIRNTDIVKESDIVVAFLSKLSRGTYDAINKAKKYRKTLYIIDI